MKRTFLIVGLALVSLPLLGAAPVAKIQAMLAKPKYSAAASIKPNSWQE
jgi:hypothetical protein